MARSRMLLLLVLAVCLHLATSVRTQARFFLPEAKQQQHNAVVEQMEALGIAPFQTADAQATWAKLKSDSSEFDLVWSATDPPFATLEIPHQFAAKVNHLPGAQLLTSPDALHQHVDAQKKKHAKFYFDFVPGHFELPRDRAKLTNAYTEVRKKAEFEPKRSRDAHVYQRFLIRESAANSNGGQAKKAAMFVTEEDLQSKLQSSEFAGKNVVVDQYVEPLLLDNHKFRVGFYVAVTSVKPLRVYVYDHPLIQIAKAEYPTKLKVESDPAAYNFDQYIAPWDFPDLQADFHELPSATRKGTNAWHVLKRHLRKKGVDTKRLQDEVDAAIAKVILSSRGNFQAEQAKLKRARTQQGDGSPSDLSDSFFDLWKFDFEIDDKAKPWLVGVVSNPSMEAQQSVLATDEAVKKQLLHDLLNLVGVHPQARLPFEKFFRPSDPKFCSDKCVDKNRAWDTACWSCPGWFSPHVARNLFTASTEYARRGNFNLVFPSLEQELTQFLDTEFSEYDIAFDRYMRALSNGYADLPDFPVSDRAVVCVYREHCSNHGDCVNGMCSCDANYEGRTCYIPKDVEQEELHIQQEAGDTGGQDAETWKERVENLWHGADAADKSNRPGAEEEMQWSFLMTARRCDSEHINQVRFTMVATSRVMPIAFLGLLQENLSLAVVEGVTYLSVFLLMLHVHSSGKRNATMLIAALLQVMIVELVFYDTERWHGHALVMMVSDRLPLYSVLLQAQLYYIAFVAVSRLRIDPFFQPFAMGSLVVLLVFPFELLGSKFLWWTWHDTDPMLADRLMGVPCHALFYYYFFAFGFLSAHHVLRSVWLVGDYYEEEHWQSEWSYVLLMPLVSTIFAMGFLILGYHSTVHLIGIEAQVCFFVLIGFSLLLFWMADRERDAPDVQKVLEPVDAYDSDWLYSCADHAVNQMVFLHSLVLVLLVLLVDPMNIVSLGHHQPLGNCLESESFYSLVGLQHSRKKYLCVHNFDEPFNLCNYPVAQLLYEDSWYMVCGGGYNNFASFAALVLGCAVVLNLLFFQILKRPQRTRIVSFRKNML
ncbi:hypothetical protein PHYBOEH_001159 [Phytophthora boehmeriae]|uniref:EGF-like domain-containing protein n=1 Tax=Phytophthora boehmeriae TaxID=109152 RepID=A0A8T1WUG5_9STRA|nr:hypothetical protein PHYBOEH_001159 [Phytophthora boehmeriae]